MNNKIRALVEKSGFALWGDEEHGPGKGKIDWSCNYEKEFDKFWKLLIKECVDISQKFGESGDGYTVASEIQKHFSKR